jgi:hypothetical protein
MPELQWADPVAAGEAWAAVISPETPPESIAGWTLRFTVAAKFGADPIITQTPAVVDATAGTFRPTLTSGQTLNTLGPGTWACEAWRVNSGGETRVAWFYLPVTASKGPPA